MIDWNDYRYFLAVSRTGSLSKAARALGVDQSTVGRRLAALEDGCGAKLFDHTPKGYVLTPAGEGVHVDIGRLEDGFLAVERRLAGTDAKPEGIVRLATTEVLATAFLVKHLPSLRAKYPKLTLELRTDNTPVDLARREADLALRIGAPPKQPNLIQRTLGAAGFSLFASPRYLARRGRPRLRDGLRGHDLVAYCGQLAIAPLGRWLDAHATEAEVVLRADNINVVHKAVIAGLGVGALPSLFAASDIERIHPDIIGTSPISTVVHEDQAQSARIRAVVDYLAQVVRRERSLLIGEVKRTNR